MRCVLLHGFAGDPSAWDEVVASWQLAEPPRMVALPGHGGGDVQASWDDNLGAVSAAIGEHDVVVGYSLGARVALGLVASGRSPRAVLVSVNPGIDDAERATRRASDATWARLLRTSGMAAFVEAWAAQPLFASQARVPEARRARRRARRLGLDAEQLARSLEVMGLAEMPDYRSTFAARAHSLALVTGGDDTRFTELAAGLPAACHEQIAGAGHDPTLEQPRELSGVVARVVARLA
jgi:2-succinyl-6-hydroxy-2,4-cyclohexadiene-1-carboxylate synthase